MPGVPSGRGCDACRKQKKKCDQAKPACARCARLKIPCIGSGKQRYKFKGSASPPFNPGVLQALVHVPSNPTGTITNAFVSRLEITDLRYDLTCYGDFLRHIPARLGHNEALDSSADALATTFSTLHGPHGYQSVDALSKYVRALKALRVCLSDPAKARTPETMCAVYLVMICQGWLGREDDHHTSHGEGLAYLLRAAAKENWKAGFETEMILTFCVPVIIESITNPNVKLDKWFWDMLDEFRKANPPTTTPESAETREKKQNSGGLPSLSMRNLGRIPDFINEPELHSMEITCAYHRLRIDMETLTQIIRAVNFPPGSSPTLMELRLSRAYHSAYSVLLSVFMIMGQLMQAFDPYNLSLVGEMALCCTEIISMAGNVSQFRPLGASHVPISLAIAWAALDEPVMKGQVEMLLSDYQEDFPVTKWMQMGWWWRNKFDELRVRLAPPVPLEEEEMALMNGGLVQDFKPPDECCVQ
ncbi:hypothetical protein ACJZ2D_015345 [Fusarium nematophilum]